MACARGKRIPFLDLEVFGEFQALCLVIRTNALAVQFFWPREHLLKNQTADDLAMFKDEGDFARTHFQHRARALAARASIAKPRIEEAGIVYAEFSDQRVEWHHLGGVI